MSKIKFGIGALQAAQENYQIILDKLIKGYEKSNWQKFLKVWILLKLNKKQDNEQKTQQKL